MTKNKSIISQNDLIHFVTLHHQKHTPYEAEKCNKKNWWRKRTSSCVWILYSNHSLPIGICQNSPCFLPLTTRVFLLWGNSHHWHWSDIICFLVQLISTSPSPHKNMFGSDVLCVCVKNTHTQTHNGYELEFFRSTSVKRHSYHSSH